MTPQERQMLDGLFERVRTAADGPKDSEAERYLSDAMRTIPSAGYVLAQTVLVQQQALENAAKHIQELEARTKTGGAEPESFLGSIGRSLFGAPTSAPPRAPDPQSYQQPTYAPQPRQAYAPAPPPQQGGPWGAPPAQGGGFLSGALQTASGVAGGMLLANAVGGMFGGHGGGMFGGGFGGGGGHETVNNYYEADPAGQHAQDVLQDQDQDQDYAQDNSDAGGGGGDYSDT